MTGHIKFNTKEPGNGGHDCAVVKGAVINGKLCPEQFAVHVQPDGVYPGGAAGDRDVRPDLCFLGQKEITDPDFAAIGIVIAPPALQIQIVGKSVEESYRVAWLQSSDQLAVAMGEFKLAEEFDMAVQDVPKLAPNIPPIVVRVVVIPSVNV